MSTADSIVQTLRTRGVQTAVDLAKRLDVSIPTISRSIGRLGTNVHRIGAARSTRYALKRSVADLPSDIPVYVIDEQGRADQLGTLTCIYPGFVFESSHAPDLYQPSNQRGGEVFDDLPWFLQDLRPQGFLGRIIAEDLNLRSGFARDPRLWNGDDVLRYLTGYGQDLPGNIVVGRTALQRALAPEPPVQPIRFSNKEATYRDHIDALRNRTPIGSSAGGERPKFTAVVETQSSQVEHVIVKYATNTNTEVGRRWKALLQLEHHAAEIMKSLGLSAATSRFGEAGDVSFLEVERFDRTNSGRRSMVSLEALSNEHIDVSLNGTWVDASIELLAKGLISAADAFEIRCRHFFGAMIGNTDMHFGNLSFFVHDGKGAQNEYPLEVTPSYDMLPMMYRPTEQGIPEAPQLPPVIAIGSDREIVEKLQPAVDEYNAFRDALLAGDVG